MAEKVISDRRGRGDEVEEKKNYEPGCSLEESYTMSPPGYPSGNPPPYGAGPPPHHGYPPPPGPPMVATAVIPTVVPVMVSPQMSPQPAPITCRSCNHQILTRVEMKPTTKTHLFAALLCLIGCWPCVCVPYCMDSCQNVDHYCPNCNSYIGSYQS